MKALAIHPGQPGVFMTDRPEPQIEAPDQVKLKILQVGICGTDREEVAGGRSQAPNGARELVIGHENFGRVAEVGAAVRSVKPGDYAMFSVRRDCEGCVCGGHNDMCVTGRYTERGIRGRDGYECAFAVDQERYLVPVPERLKAYGVLAEPMSVSEKAINEAMRIQAARLPASVPGHSLEGRQALVAGLGPIGLLAALILRLRGAQVLGLDVVDTTSSRPRLLAGIGGKYVDGRLIQPAQLQDHFGQIDLIFEATGIASLEFALLGALGINGLYVLTGIPAGTRPMTLVGAPLIQQLVLKNQLMLGSVNAGLDDFHQGIRDLELALDRFPDFLNGFISNRFAVPDFQTAFASHGPGEIKSILEWEKP